MSDKEYILGFEPFPKLSRLRRGCVISEKIDGTNAQIQFDDVGNIMVGSRKREIYPEGTQYYLTEPDKVIKGTDNFAFAQWAYANRDQLFAFLGKGRHYGEWAGSGIQRGYDLDHKRFFLFNTARFGPGRQAIPEELLQLGLDTVPVLYEGPFTTDAVDDTMANLAGASSINNYHKPEGIVVYHTALRESFKVTYEHDNGKWNHGAEGDAARGYK